MKKIKENIGTIIYFIILFGIIFIRFPYQVYEPGGIINVSSRLENIPNKSVGSFNQTYISVHQGDIVSLFLGWLLPDYEIIPASELKISNESLDEMNKRDRVSYEYGISSATYVAYTAAEIEPNITSSEGGIYYIFEGARTDLKIGDRILKYDNKDYTNEGFFNYIKEKKIDEKIEFDILRDNKEIKAYAIVSDIKDSLIEEYQGIGVLVFTINKYQNKPDVYFSIKPNELGSSGSLMLTLGLYDALVKEDITKGLKIAGTGSIEVDGRVSEIAGVKYKIMGAVKNKCDVFLVPEENYEEALEVVKKRHYKIKLISVSTFDEAIKELDKLNGSKK